MNNIKGIISSQKMIKNIITEEGKNRLLMIKMNNV